MKIGSHVSASGSVDLSFDRAHNIGAECFQIFLSPPQRWLETPVKEDVQERFLARSSELGPNFVHGTYLINLGAEGEEHLAKSISWLRYGLLQSGLLGIKGVIFHLGSHKGVGFEAVRKQVVESLKKILDQESLSLLILETSAGAGGNIGGRFEELEILLKQVGDPRLKVCLDSAHIFSAGYELRTREGLHQTLKHFDGSIGLENLVVVHANDSKTDFGSNKDRHQNIGEGFIGLEGFNNLINDSRLSNIPFILEVPGVDGNGPDKVNIDILKALR